MDLNTALDLIDRQSKTIEQLLHDLKVERERNGKLQDMVNNPLMPAGVLADHNELIREYLGTLKRMKMEPIDRAAEELEQELGEGKPNSNVKFWTELNDDYNFPVIYMQVKDEHPVAIASFMMDRFGYFFRHTTHCQLPGNITGSVPLSMAIPPGVVIQYANRTGILGDYQRTEPKLSEQRETRENVEVGG